MKTKPHIIMGFFWQGEPTTAFLRQFVGEIEIDKEGKFTGHLKDELGGSTIRGEAHDNRLIFTKEYYPEAIGSEKLIFYQLSQQNFKAERNLIYGGWFGVWKIEAEKKSKKSDTSGQAVCMIFPRS